MKSISDTSIPVIFVDIPVYHFDPSSNPFAWDTTDRKQTDDIVVTIDRALRQSFAMDHTLIRGVQSGHHKLDRQKLLEAILENGSDTYNELSEARDMYAKQFSYEMLRSIIDGFHVFKPKCKERPQYPVDIWMVFDKNAFDNIEYLHPRHNTVAQDKWRRKSANDQGLKGILVIN